MLYLSGDCAMLVFMILASSMIRKTYCCLYPPFLQSEGNPNRRWMYHIHNQGARAAETNLYIVTFHNDVMEVTADINVLDPPDRIRPYRRQCLETSDSDSFIASHEFSDDTGVATLKFLCVQFTPISPYVVLVHEGVPMGDYNPRLCNGSMTTDYWPMVSFLVEHEEVQQHIPESLIGGYHFTMKDAQTDEIICSTNDLYPSRLDVACSPDNAMIFSLSDDCGHSDLKMNRYNSLYSLGNWKMFNYRFMILKNAKSLNIWCFRIPDDLQLNNFTAQLFLDVMCDPGPILQSTVKYLELNMDRTPYTSLCQDISSQCANNTDVCNSRNINARTTCLGTCESCTPAMLHADNDTYVGNDSCIFHDIIQGAWVHASVPSVRDEILVLPSKIYPGLLGSEPLKCMPTPHQITNRYPLMSIADNGCFPHFTCVEFTVESPGVVSYQLGWISYWPEDSMGLTDPYDVFCADNQFQGKYDAVTQQYKQPSIHSMVHDPRGPDFLNRTSACVIGNINSTVVSFERLPGQTGERCQGDFSVHCLDPSIIQIDHSGCEHWPIESTTYHCMSSLLLNDGRRLVVTVANRSSLVPADDIDLRCWMFSKNLNNLYILPWADCSEDTFDEILNADKYREERDVFVIDIKDQYSRTCEEEPTTTAFEGIAITVFVEVETTAYQFPDFVGRGVMFQLSSTLCVTMATMTMYIKYY